MSSHLRDPKGYYATLGVPSTADAAAIKSAYRNRAKVLHPDHNKSPTAQADFQKLAEAYQILSDDQKRRRYDSMGARLAAATSARAQNAGHAGAAHPSGSAQGAKSSTTSNANHAAQAQANSAKSGARAYTQTASYGTRPKARSRSATGPFEPPAACQCCGKVTAQPRYVVFPTVRGRLFKSVRGTVEGILCRQCADKIALTAAWKNWILGWWSLPLGPFHTLAALGTIARGGFFPRDRNFALLLKQSRAFLMREETALAHALALQARAYAETPQERTLADGLIKATPAPQGKSLRNKWLEGSWRRTAQALPPALVAGAVLFAVHQWTDINLWGLKTAPQTVASRNPILDGNLSVNLPPSLQPQPNPTAPLLPEGLDRPLLLRTGGLYEVTAPTLPLRTGPGTSYTVLARLDAGAMVLVTENAPEGGWVRVLTAEGASGFVSGRYLTPGLNNRGLDEGFGKPPAPENKAAPRNATAPPIPLTPPAAARPPESRPPEGRPIEGRPAEGRSTGGRDAQPPHPETTRPESTLSPSPQLTLPRVRSSAPPSSETDALESAPSTSLPSVLSPTPSLSRPGAIQPNSDTPSSAEGATSGESSQSPGSVGVFEVILRKE